MKTTKSWIVAVATALALLVTSVIPAFAADEKKPLTSRPDQLVKEEVVAMYSLNTTDQTYHRITGDDLDILRGKINKLSLSKGAPPDTDKGGAYGFFVWLTDGTRISYYLSESEFFCGDGYFKTNQKDRDALIKLCKQYNGAYAGTPRWLAYMSQGKMVSATCEGWYDNGNSFVNLDTKDSELLAALDKACKGITAKSGKTVVQSETSKAPWKTERPLDITINFNTDITYTIVVDDQSLSVWSSDRKTNLHYKLSDKAQVDALREAVWKHAVRLKAVSTAK